MTFYVYDDNFANWKFERGDMLGYTVDQTYQLERVLLETEDEAEAQRIVELLGKYGVVCSTQDPRILHNVAA